MRKGAIAPWAKTSLALLRADARGARPSTTSSRSTRQWKDLPEEDAGRHPLRHRRRRDQLHLRRRHALLQDQEAVRGRHQQSRAPLQGNRERLGARGAAEVFQPTCPARPATAIASSPRRWREDRRQAHRRSLRTVGQARRRLVHRAAAAAHRQAERDRRRAC